jgi:predicted DNA-binding antitoxin AbrB/MazE fold protein
MIRMETQHIQAIFEGGVLLPLQPLQLDELECVEVTVVRTSSRGPLAEDALVSPLLSEADDTVTLQQVQQAMSKIPGSLVDDFACERDNRF